MKKLLPLLFILVSITVFAGGYAPATLNVHKGAQLGHSAQPLLQTPTVKVNRSAALKSVMLIPEYDEDKCRKYKGMLIGGGVALGVGVSLITGGSILIHIGTGGVFGGIGYEDKDVPMIVGGALMIVWGIVGTAAGIPILAIGAAKTHRYCGDGGSRGGGRQSSQLNLELIKRGNSAGLALRF